MSVPCFEDHVVTAHSESCLLFSQIASQLAVIEELDLVVIESCSDQWDLQKDSRSAHAGVFADLLDALENLVVVLPVEELLDADIADDERFFGEVVANAKVICDRGVAAIT